MARRTYIISVSAKGVLNPEHFQEAFEELPRVFGLVKEISRAPWYLTQGLDERIYMAFGDVPATPEEAERLMIGVEDLRKRLEERKLNIGIYTVEKFF